MKRRIELIEYDAACDETRALYDEAMATLGTTKVPNWMKAQGRSPPVLRSNWEKFKNTVLTGAIPPLLKQLILFVISVRESNEYCIAAHGNWALSLDTALSCDDLYSLARGESYVGLPNAFRTAIEVVTKLALQPDSIAVEDFVSTLAGAGFSGAEIDELLAQADFGVMMNIIMAINHVPADVPFPRES